MCSSIRRVNTISKTEDGLGEAFIVLKGSLDNSAVNRFRDVDRLAVADYPAAKQTLESRGCTFVFENESPNAIFGTILDPDGNALQIQQRR